MEQNELQLKERFFAQYWGQIIKSALYSDFPACVNENNKQ